MISRFNLIRFLESSIKWRKKIFQVTFIAFILSLGVSFWVEPTYESITTIYPSNPSLSDKAFAFESGQGHNPVEPFGSKEDIDRIVSIAKSKGNTNSSSSQLVERGKNKSQPILV